MNESIAQTGKERDTARIVDAALELYSERGPARVSLREVAQRAGVNYGLIHQYVGTKEQLLRLVFTRSSEVWTDAFASAGGAESAAGVLLRAKSSTYVRMLAHVILEGRDPSVLVGSNPAMKELVRRLDDDADDGSGIADARLHAAVLTGMSMGWGLFGPYLRLISGLDDVPQDELDERVYAYLREVFAAAR
ncbi:MULTISPECIES: TetR/AcrR family transcriptional regulator [unclassified Gordonia (in: high G+C Gram-positive bacteria)]|uniref:TetR/AcrR family transcriptional regulator n=1 Tax=unclassified Gordonia (in: high G+C Gram-positive bacteria) TaxID=2657482 RepID=UPI001F06784C|nr:TetR/AcrR family transcriptional regulator [Gordonia sp. PDNC005]